VAASEVLVDSFLTALKALRAAHTYAGTGRASTAWKHCDRAGRLLHAARHEAVRTMRRDGMTWAAISEATGVSTSTLQARYGGSVQQLTTGDLADELERLLPRPRRDETDEEFDARIALRSQIATLRGFV
jgi:hypothetical protein